MKRIFLIIASALLPVLCTVNTLTAQDPIRFHQGDSIVSAAFSGTTFNDSSAWTIGASWNYFVTDLTAPGIKTNITLGDYFMAEVYGTVDQYLWNTGYVFPLLFVNLGYFHTDLSIYGEKPARGFIFRGGPALVIFASEGLAIRGEFYYQTYLLNGREKITELSGTGINLGISLFL
jgi:hypothetical protein